MKCHVCEFNQVESITAMKRWNFIPSFIPEFFFRLLTRVDLVGLSRPAMAPWLIWMRTRRLIFFLVRYEVATNFPSRVVPLVSSHFGFTKLTVFFPSLLRFNGFYWVLPSFTGFYFRCITWEVLGLQLIFLGYIRFHRLWSSFTEWLPGFLPNFTGFRWILLGFTGFYWVLLGSLGFCWVLLNFTGFHWIFIRFDRVWPG